MRPADDPVDLERVRVQRIKRLILEGRYRPSATCVAEAMLRRVSEPPPANEDAGDSLLVAQAD